VTEGEKTRKERGGSGTGGMVKRNDYGKWYEGRKQGGNVGGGASKGEESTRREGRLKENLFDDGRPHLQIQTAAREVGGKENRQSARGSKTRRRKGKRSNYLLE